MVARAPAAAEAAQLSGEPPHGYVRAATMVAGLTLGWVQSRIMPPPKFRFPAIEVAAGLDQIGHLLAENESAQRLVHLLVREISAIGGEPPTVMMLRLALAGAGVKWETCSLRDLGFDVPTA